MVDDKTIFETYGSNLNIDNPKESAATTGSSRSRTWTFELKSNKAILSPLYKLTVIDIKFCVQHIINW